MKRVWGLALALGGALLALPAMAQTTDQAPSGADKDMGANHLRLCTGSPSGNYHFAGMEILSRVGGGKEVNTDGSLTNLRDLMDGTCTIAFSQSDVFSQFALEQPASLGAIEAWKVVYTEYVHILCPVVAGWTRVNHLGKAQGNLIVGPNGTGSAETWRILRQADDSLYEKVGRLPDPVDRESLTKVKDSKDTCVLWVSGVNAASMKIANMMSVNTKDHQPSMMLLDVNDRDMKSIKGLNGKPMYEWKEIDRKEPSGGNPGLYENIMQSSSVSVPTVDAVLVVRSDWLKAIRPSGKADRLVQAVEDASPTIWKTVNPDE
jgi:TRAP-type uncharacterized transport system substrate-binding protein